MTFSGFYRFRTIEQMLNDFFYSFDERVKPPVSAEVLGSQEECGGVRVQLALAGYRKEDIEVYTEKNVLYVKGDNTKRADVHDKFKSTFQQRYPVSKELDLEKVEVKFEDGLLSISIPLCVEETKRNFLFGGVKK